MALEWRLRKAARITWRHRSWWALGLLATAGGLLFNLLARGGAWYAAGRFWPPALDFQQFPAPITQPETLIAGTVVALLLGLLWWLTGAVAEGGLIVAVDQRAADDALDAGHLLRAGLSLLGRFVAIDTVLFLPLFLLTLALLAVGFGGLAGLSLVATRPMAELTDLLLVAGLTTAVGIPIMFMILTTGAILVVMRALAFRAAVLEGLKTGESIRHAWRVLWQGPLAVAILALVLTALRSVVGSPLRFASLAVTGLGWGQLALRLADPGSEASGVSLLVFLGGAILALASWLVSGIMNAFSSAAWTLSYEAWTSGRERGQPKI